jgi:methyltransferase
MFDDLAGGAWLVGFLVAQRLVELVLAQRNTARLRATGAVEFGALHYPFIVALHAFWLLGLWLFGHNRDVNPIGLGFFVALQVIRLWILLSLGRHWSTRVLVLPGTPKVVRGPYRWLRHPNYCVVAAEIALVPMALGLPLFALFFSIANAVLLALRIRVENKALSCAEITG